MTTPHSPLPPPLPVSLELVSAKLDRAIIGLELMAVQVQKLDSAREESARMERSMRSIAARLSGAALALSAARVAAAVVPSGRWLAVTAGMAFAGGFVGSVIWQMVHVSQVLAAP